MVLERKQSDISREPLRCLVLPPESSLNGQSVEACVAEGLQCARSLRRPTVITLINRQWIDAESASCRHPPRQPETRSLTGRGQGRRCSP